MDVQCIYESPRDACLAVLDLYKSPKEKRRLFPIPYNRFAPEYTTWWLSPVGVNPAYKHGKFSFEYCGERGIRVGLYVEKGLGRDCTNVRSQIMDNTWYWHQFVKEMVTDRFAAALDTIHSNLGLRPEIYIEAFFHYECSREAIDYGKCDRITFLWNSDKRFDSLKEDFKGTALDNLAEVNDLTSLASRLQVLPNSQFLWIDLVVGVHLGLKGKLGTSLDAWGIARNIMQPLDLWVK